jgi:hypothetical protein
VVVIGLVLFLLVVPAQIYRERLFRRQHGPDVPLPRELRYGRFVYGAMGIVLVATVIAALA